MRKVQRNIFLTAFLLILTGQFSFAFSQALMEQKLNLEKSIQERTERIVEKIIGSRDMIVLVNADLAPEEPKQSNQQQPLYPGQQMQDEEYLPGITYSYMPTEGRNAPMIIIKIPTD